MNPPSESPSEETAINNLSKGAGFVCMLARKNY